jgi:hypothetical protein
MRTEDGAAPRDIEEEKVIIPESKEEATTSLASLFANIKL